MLNFFYLFLGIQGALILIDEFYFHHRREVPLWERWGHPLDTLSVLLVFVLLYFFGSSALSVVASVFSCFFIAKDEWVHKQYSSGTENWLHALLFVIHPVIFFFAHQTAGSWSVGPMLALTLFLIYQILYWNFYANRAVQKRP